MLHALAFVWLTVVYFHCHAYNGYKRGQHLIMAWTLQDTPAHAPFRLPGLIGVCCSCMQRPLPARTLLHFTGKHMKRLKSDRAVGLLCCPGDMKSLRSPKPCVQQLPRRPPPPPPAPR